MLPRVTCQHIALSPLQSPGWVAFGCVDVCLTYFALNHPDVLTCNNSSTPGRAAVSRMLRFSTLHVPIVASLLIAVRPPPRTCKAHTRQLTDDGLLHAALHPSNAALIRPPSRAQHRRSPSLDCSGLATTRSTTLSTRPPQLSQAPLTAR